MYRKVIAASSFISVFLIAGTVRAAVFPDVPQNHIYREAIEMLVGMEVVGGNPDGMFAPERSVNRAEMLKMLYKATGREARAVHAECFPDVEKGSWYEMIVCDATENGFVQGYSDGTFRPGHTVNRVEAIKMIAEVFDFPIGDLMDEDRGVVKFVDVSVSAWYTKYLYAAFRVNLLPIEGQVGPRFYPDWPLLRGEAAAYIKNALTVDVGDLEEEEVVQEERKPRETEQTQSSDASTSSSLEGQAVQDPVQNRQTQPDIETSIFHTTFPFDAARQFNQKRPHIYRFNVQKTRVVDIQIGMSAGNAGGVTCRLYRFGEDGFSLEYYLGFQDGGSCYLLSALGPGEYQLQLQPTVSNTSYDVVAKDGAGDGNDGFAQAKRLGSIPLVENLEANDLADWYTFKVESEIRIRVELAAQADLGCFIYPMDDVDIYGFSGPQCNEEYLYPSGTYYVGITRVPPRATRHTYTIRLK